MDISVSVNTVATMFLLILVGFGVRKFNWIDKDTSKRLSDLILCIAQPFLLISSIVNTEYSPTALKEGGLIILLSFLLHVLSALFAFLCSRPLKDKGESAIMQYALIFENAAFYGFPVLAAVLGDKGLFWGAFYCIIFNILSWTYGMFVLSSANRSIKMNIKKVFVNFGTIPAAIGVLIFVLRIPLPVPVKDTMSYFAGLSTPISMLIIGGVLANLPFKKLFTNLKVYWLCLCKLVLFPVIVGTIVILLRLPRDIALFATLMASMPTAATTTVFGEKFDIKPEYSALCVGISTVISVVTIPMIILVFDAIVK
ncbi:MAG: AEC family transporter [Clostridia bacterium]|nr:AEC family transporter [Clostridia bacterium]